MIQIDLDKVATLLREHGINFADHPEIALQAMMLNEQLKNTPEFDLEAIQALMLQLFDTVQEHES